jgi:uncharacterized membrane protein YjjP (DUF1212 family)
LKTSVVPKVRNGFIAGAIVTIITWLLQQFAHIDLPGDVAAAIVTIISLIVGYQTSGA